MGGHCFAGFWRKAVAEIFVGFIDKTILFAHRITIGRPHADRFVSAQYSLGGRCDLFEITGGPALDMLHSGHARRDHFKR